MKAVLKSVIIAAAFGVGAVSAEPTLHVDEAWMKAQSQAASAPRAGQAPAAAVARHRASSAEFREVLAKQPQSHGE